MIAIQENVSGNFQTCPKLIFEISKNIQKVVLVLEIFGLVRKVFGISKKSIVDFTVSLIWIFSDMSEIIFQNFWKMHLLHNGQIWSCGYKSSTLSTCEGCWTDWIFRALSWFILRFTFEPCFLVPPLYPGVIRIWCVWVLWIRVCESACCWLREDLWAPVSSLGVFCIIFYSWRLRTTRRLGVTPEPPIYVWFAGKSLWRSDLTSKREEIPLVEGGVICATSWGKA